MSASCAWLDLQIFDGALLGTPRHEMLVNIGFSHYWPDDIRFQRDAAYWLEKLGGMAAAW